MKNILKKFGIIDFVLAGVVAVFAGSSLPANATGVKLSDNNEGVDWIEITRTIHGVSNYVNNDFSYMISQDYDNPEMIDNLDRNADVFVSGMPDKEGNVTAKEKISLADLEFKTLGDYKFTVKEVESEDSVNYPIDSEKEYYFYISVRNELDNSGQPTGKYVATLSSQARNHDTGDKTDASFESTASRSRIAVTNMVTGNLANKDEYFKFKIKFDNAQPGDIFKIYGQDDIVNYNGEEILTLDEIFVGDEDSYIYLKHGQTVYIGYDGENNQIPIGVSYSLEEVEDKGYVRYVDDVLGDKSEIKTVVADIEAPSNKVDFLNHKEGSILTGIMMDLQPFLMMLGGIGIGLVFTKITKKVRKNKKCSR